MIDKNTKLTGQQAVNDVVFKSTIDNLADQIPLIENAENDAFLMIHAQYDGKIGNYTTVSASGLTYAMAAGLVNAGEHDSQIRQAIYSAAGYLQSITKTDQPVSSEALEAFGKVKIALDVPDVYYPPLPAASKPVEEPAPAAPVDTTLDLFDGLPRTGVLTNWGEWTRSLDEQILQAERYTNWFTAALGSKTLGKDLYLWFQMAKSITVTVERTLPVGEVSEWTLYGGISYGASQPNGDLKDFTETGEGGQFLDILDDSGLIIARLAPRQNYVGRVASLVANGQELTSGELTKVKGVFAVNQPLSIACSGPAVVFSYADYPDFTTALRNLSANWKRPAMLRITMFQSKGGSNKREVILSELKFKSK